MQKTSPDTKKAAWQYPFNSDHKILDFMQLRDGEKKYLIIKANLPDCSEMIIVIEKVDEIYKNCMNGKWTIKGECCLAMIERKNYQGNYSIKLMSQESSRRFYVECVGNKEGDLSGEIWLPRNNFNQIV
jgi:hypothetical protein